MQTSFKEEFKPINGFKSVKDDTYEVSNLGNIRRIGEKENKKVRKDKDGYIVTSLLDRYGHARNQKIHRLVAYVFVKNDNPNIKKQVNHKNEKKDDNRARGSHDVNLMVNIVKELTESGMSDAWIVKNIGMDADELLRLKQISGLASLFQDKDYSRAWE